MSTSQPALQVTPERILDLINAHQQTAAMKAAIELDIFTAIGEGGADAASLAQRCQCSEPNGDAYTLSQCQRMPRNAGFRSCDHVPLPVPEQALFAEM